VSRAVRAGRVVDKDGRPVAGVLVSVVWGTAPTPEIGRRTNDAGVFQVALPPGRFRVQAVTRSGDTGEVEVEGSEGGEIIITVESA